MSNERFIDPRKRCHRENANKISDHVTGDAIVENVTELLTIEDDLEPADGVALGRGDKTRAMSADDESQYRRIGIVRVL